MNWTAMNWTTIVLAIVTSFLFGTTLYAEDSVDLINPVPGDFRITQFATGLNSPIGMTELPDGSIAVAVSNGSIFGSTTGSIIRLVDSDNDGVSDTQTTLVGNVPGGGLTALRGAGDLLFTTGQGETKPISIYRVGATPGAPLTLQGTISIDDSGFQHRHSALSVRETPGTPGSYDLVFQVGSKRNAVATTETVSVTSSIGVGGNINGDALHMVTITDHGSSISGSNLIQLATGLRNAAGHAFHPVTGDLYLQDNGIDGISPVPAQEPTSADELNVIAAADIGGAIEDFGFPNNYEEYRTGLTIGNPAFSPLVAFQPIPSPNGAEGEGPNDIAFAPASFPEGLNNGIFVGMHGQFRDSGIANEENPLVFVDLNDNSYFHFVENTLEGVGHLDGLLSTGDSLFVADIDPNGDFSTTGTGVIYQITYLSNDFLDGDFDFDGDVDGDDLTKWQSNFGLNSDGDADGDEDTDGADFLIWQQQLGSGVTTLVESSLTVPEPSSGLLILIGLLATNRRRFPWQARVFT